MSQPDRGLLQRAGSEEAAIQKSANGNGDLLMGRRQRLQARVGRMMWSFVDPRDDVDLRRLAGTREPIADRYRMSTRHLSQSLDSLRLLRAP